MIPSVDMTLPAVHRVMNMNRQKPIPRLRAQLVDVVGKQIIALKLFDEADNATRDDAYCGIIAANRVLQRLLGELADFCVNAPVSQ